MSDKGHPDEPLLTATQSHGVILKEQYATRTVEATKALETLKLVRVDDFVISLRSFQGGIERAHARGIISPAYTILRAIREVDRDYLTLLFKTQPFIDALRLAVTGIREGQNVEYPRLARQHIPVPPPREQEAIVAYLAHAQERITKAIVAKRRLVALLEEQKRAIVNHFVTRGTNPSPHLVDSGIPWIGAIPAHWELSPARYLFRPVTRQVATSSLPQLSLTRFAGLIRSGTGGSNTKAAEGGGNLQECEWGDFVLNKYRAHMGLFRWCREPGLVTRNYTVLVPSERVDRDYFEYLFLDPVFADGLRINARGVGDGMSPLYTSTLMSMKMPLPALDEQRSIANRISSETARIDSEMGLVRREIQLLEEFKVRLVADVVTGRVDVRRIAARLPAIDVAQALAAGAGATDDDDEVEHAMENDQEDS
ncbi:restriction endonuclease subunit S [Geodermatophilus sp. CPCC 205761]|uniref:restriction endonuclease subunit S n=1 Tax=Geodermatophilus sp. CPCC 205761 TaxID=2936597 RepID=UPI003EEF137E